MYGFSYCNNREINLGVKANVHLYIGEIYQPSKCGLHLLGVSFVQGENREFTYRKKKKIGN